jgi:hypothetical protein
LLVYQGTVTVVNSTFINNQAAAKGGAIRIYLGSGTVNIKNSIFWNNTATTADNDISTNTGGIFSIQNSLLQVASCPTNITCGTGMLYNQNPLFVNLAGGDLCLQACSPAINAGTSSGAPANDILGNARVGATDMGAYEFQGNPIVINAPTVTQPTCTTPTGSIVVNATGTGTLEYSIDNGTNWQSNATFSGLAVGNYTIKVRTQGSPSCEVSYGSNPVVLTSPFTVSTTTDIWTGCVSTNWATPGNWADGSVPTAADDAVIPNTTNKPTIIGGTAALAKTIEVQSGATLTIAATASLTVNGSKSISGNTIALFNGGTVTNSGLVAIGGSTLADIGKYGIRNEGTFTNSTGGNIQIDRWTDTGLYNQAGSFTNSGNITLGASAATGKDGLFNNAIFNNTGAGLIQIDRSFTAGISNLFSATFTNSATIIIGSLASVGTHGILNQATFNNNACGKILMSLGNYTNFSGTTTNAGLIQMPNTSNFYKPRNIYQ